MCFTYSFSFGQTTQTSFLSASWGKCGGEREKPREVLTAPIEVTAKILISDIFIKVIYGHICLYSLSQ